MNWSEVTALFGGAFDPPHLGHREAVEGLLKYPGVGAVRIIPTGSPALKTAQTPGEHRLAMTKLNFTKAIHDKSSRITIDDREIRAGGDRPSYTFDTLQELRKEGLPFAFVLGVDQVEALDQWHRFPDLLGLCHWIALEREPGGSDRMRKATQRLVGLGVLVPAGDERTFETRPGASGKPTRFICVPTPARAASSTDIRRRFALNYENSAPVTENLDPRVRAYLNANHLYGT